MDSDTSQSLTADSDLLIDEVRRIRREISERNGHDLDRLFEELRQVESEYAARRGIFSAVSSEAAARVEASWGDLSGPGSDPVIEQVRALRSGQ